MFFILLGMTLANTYVAYYDKKGASMGLGRVQYYFLKALGILPFVGFLFIVYPFELTMSLPTILLLIALLANHAINQFGFVGLVRKTSPYETGMYITLTIPIVYFIDVLLGSRVFSFTSLGFLAIIIAGVVILAEAKFSKNALGKDLWISILSIVVKGYILHFLLAYMSISVYMLLLYGLTTIIAVLFLNKKIGPNTKETYMWAFKSQSIGTLSLTLNAVLAKSSVSLYMLKTPLNLIFMTISSFFIKNEKLGERPTAIKFIGSIVTITGVILYTFIK